MINSNDSIRFKNVVSKKYRFHYGEMDRVMGEFLKDVDRLGVTIKGPLFYSINNVPMDEIVNAEFFIPIKEDRVDISKGMQFHSYFSIEDMISFCLYDDFQNKTEAVYRILLDFIEENKLIQVTPIFHVLSGDRSLQYAFIKIGVIGSEE